MGSAIGLLQRRMRLPTSWKVHVTSGAPEATKQSLLKKEIASPRSQWLRVMGLRTHPVPQGVLVRDISMSLLTDQLVAYTQEKRLSTQTLRRWQSWVEEDQAALLVVAKELQLNENQLRDFLDWLEEIVTRDGVAVRDVFEYDAIVFPPFERFGPSGLVNGFIALCPCQFLNRAEGGLLQRL